jgi:hypothetical protein
MPREDHTSSDRSFDDLARAVAEGSLSRRRALKLFAGTALDVCCQVHAHNSLMRP